MRTRAGSCGMRKMLRLRSGKNEMGKWGVFICPLKYNREKASRENIVVVLVCLFGFVGDNSGL